MFYNTYTSFQKIFKIKYGLGGRRLTYIIKKIVIFTLKMHFSLNIKSDLEIQTLLNIIIIRIPSKFPNLTQH